MHRFTLIHSWLRPGIAPLIVLGIAGCARLPELPDKSVSQAWQQPETTRIAKFFAKAAPLGSEGKSAVRLISLPHEAFHTRYSLAALAEHSLDFQYYLWKGDHTGSLLLQRALEAADRGVHVRILIDDIYHHGRDPLYAAIAAHSNAEVRVFNPKAHRGIGRNLEMLFRMSRLNHRMHNKIFLVDNAAAILGGRNIGDDYFGTDPRLDFHDLDAVAIGPVAQLAGDAFDTYWNSPLAVPADALYPKQVGSDELQQLRDQLANTYEEHLNELAYPLPEDAQMSLEALAQIRSEFEWVDAEIVVDDLARFEEHRESDIFEFLNGLAQKSERELLLQTAYLIPTDATIEGFKRMVDRGVRVRIMTNSLRSNNHLAVHAHYKKHRKALLEAGVELYELRIDDTLFEYLRESATQIADSRAGLHTKAFVIDGQTAVIGSYNMDPRSRVWNSEIALIVRDTTIAEQVQTLMQEAMSPANAYQVVLNEDGQLRWILDLPEGRQVFTQDPESTWAQRTLANIISWLPIRNQL